MMRSIIFFDQHCNLCRRTISFLIKQDQKNRFDFAPLDGTEALRRFSGNLAYLRDLNTVILVEAPQAKIWLRGKAVFRILWLLGGRWKLVGWLYVMPFVDLFYKLIAKHRR